MKAHLQPFEFVVAEHGPAVLRVCRALLGPDEADDAWSETFLSALRAYPRLRPDSNVEAWLVTIAHRKAVDALRRRGRAPWTMATLPEQHSTTGIPGAADADLPGALAKLPLKQRSAIVCHYLGGLPYAEVAVILGNSEDAARRAAADGMRRLRALYRKGEDYETGRR